MDKLNYKECEKCQDWNGNIVHCINICGKPLDALEEFNQYRSIGTLDECREAREKQIAKKPILDVIYHTDYYCPCCEMFVSRTLWKDNSDMRIFVKPKNCRHCGQALDWSDKDD